MKFNLYILTVVAFSIAFGFYFFNQNPYDMGDSIVHYGISKYSWEHHELFLDHWGKPIFTILSSPFSQFGFSGMAAFNTLVGVLTVIVTALIIEKLDLSISPYVAILLLFIPEYTLALHSGLTEPLYGLFVVIAFYLILMQQYTWSVVVVSFLPYVRSEGFITLTVILVYLIVIKKYQSIIWAVLGSVVLAVLGAVLLKDNLLWVFNKTPYVVPENAYPNYGSGNWSDYFIKLYYLTGLPFIISFYLSSGFLLYGWFKIKDKFNPENLLPVFLLALFFSYFFAHVVFWTFGIFKSFGMARVMLSIVPIGYIIIVYAWGKMKWHQYVQYAIMIIFIIFPFSENKSAFNMKEDFSKPDEWIKIEAVSSKLPPINTHVYYTNTPIMLLLGYDVYDTLKYSHLNRVNIKKERGEYCVFADDWYRQTDLKIDINHPIFTKSTLIDSFKISDANTLRIYQSAH